MRFLLILVANLAVSYASLGANSDLVVLLVDKTALKAHLQTWPEGSGEPRLLRTFNVAIGKEKGDKQREGDNRTPEGVYFTDSIIDGNTLPDKYGPWAITLNYPNPMDKTAGKTGHGIWLHGVIDDSRVEEANVTEGCVAFYNSDISLLTHWLRPGQGVVVIADSLTHVNLKPDIEETLASTRGWLQAWNDRRLDLYMNFYSQAFTFKGMNLPRYTEHKKNVFNAYRSMQVTMTNLRVLTHPKYAVSVMDQDFNGDNRYKTSGRKLLYWSRQDSSGKFEIAREVHENRRFEYLTYHLESSQDGKFRAVILNKDTAVTQSRL